MRHDSTHPAAWLPEEWQRAIEDAGERAYRAAQVFRWIHRRGTTDPRAMTDLPAAFRERLADLGLQEPARVVRVHRSDDATRKLVLAMGDGARVECVLIPMSAADDDEPVESLGSTAARQRVTLCISTQHGCKMRCAFCASGQGGFRRHLNAAEIVFQVMVARQYLDPEEELGNLVFMGMGEPLDCYEQTARALRLLIHPEGAALSPRRITVSTVGLVEGIERLGRDFEGKVGLALSLHASDDATRERLVPAHRRTPIARLIGALREYPLPRRRRITIEYTLVEGINDSPDQARALSRLLRGLQVKINLIPMNPIPGCSLGAPPPDRVEAFREVLAEQRYSCFVRTRRGDDVSAACGQLALGPAAS